MISRAINALVIFIACCACACGAELDGGSKPSAGGAAPEKSLCSMFAAEGQQGNKKVVKTIGGCPIYEDDLTLKEMPNKTPSADMIDKVRRKDLEVKDREVKLFLLAEKNGYLKRPDVQTKMMRIIGNSYLKDISITPKVSDESVIEYYNKNRDLYNIPDYRFARYIYLSYTNKDKAEVNDTCAKVRAGFSQKTTTEEFARIASQLSDDKTTSWQGGLLPATGLRGEHLKIDGSLAEALFLLKSEGDIANPVITEKGCHVLQYVREVKGQEVPFERVKNLMRSKLEDERFMQEVDALLANHSFD